MKRLVVFAVFVAGAWWNWPGSMAAQESPTASRRSVWDRVYTDAQAARGELVYARQCEQCHGSGLEGDTVSEVPGLAGDPFLQRWSGRSVDDLVMRMVRSMPQADPGSLSRTQYVDLAAYILKTNGFPAGFEGLGTDAERLKPLLIERSPANTAR